jgi:arylsulfatase A-like enzyme
MNQGRARCLVMRSSVVYFRMFLALLTFGTTAGAGSAPLAQSPTSLYMDLGANHLRFHRYRSGLVIDFGNESFRKYDLAYDSPWRPSASGSTLTGGEATLTVPWLGGAARLTLSVSSSKGPFVVRANGRAHRGLPVVQGNKLLVMFDLGELAAGDHEMRLNLPRAVTVFRAELASSSAVACPVEGPIGIVPNWLGNARALDIVVEIPPAASLHFAVQGRAPAEVWARPADAPAVKLWSSEAVPATAAVAEQIVSLASFAGQLVTLSLRSDTCGAIWVAPRIDVSAAIAKEPAPIKNVILLVVDTLRADRLSMYGNTRVKTPRLTAAAAARGLVMLRNQSMAPSSPPSHATIQTGQIPRVHGAVGDQGAIKSNAPVLSAILKTAGFWTGYVGNNDFAMGRFRKIGQWDSFHTPAMEGKGIDCTKVVAGALDMVDVARKKQQRFFISMLPTEPHVPYRFHPGITETYFAGPFAPPFGKQVTGQHLDRFKSLRLGPRSMEQLRGLHDGEVAYFDTCYGALEDGLVQRGVDKDTVIVLASDHGEGLGERGGRVGHAYSLNHELVTVPFIVIGSAMAPGYVSNVSSNADIAPTVLQLLGVPADERMQGISVIAPAGGALPRVVASEYGKSYAIRAGDWHYVVPYDGKPALFDIKADPQETIDRSKASPMWLRYVKDAAGMYLAHRVQWRVASWGPLNNFSVTNPLLQR